jgi:hypothetical protein
MRPPAARKPNCRLLPVRHGLLLESQNGTPAWKASHLTLCLPCQDSRRMPGYDKKRAHCRVSRSLTVPGWCNGGKTPVSPPASALLPVARAPQALPAKVKKHPHHERNGQDSGNKIGKRHKKAAHRIDPASALRVTRGKHTVPRAESSAKPEDTRSAKG